MGAQQWWLAVAVVMLGYIVGFYFQHRDLDKLETSLNRRIDELRSEMNARFAALHELLRSEIKRLEDRLDRVERPIVRG
jgi:Tfp pilus assembly protein PilO